MPSYMFDIGDSGKGPIGAAIRVTASSPEDAVIIVRHVIDEMGGVHGVMRLYDDCTDHKSKCPHPNLEYVRVFINTNYISENDIHDIREDEPMTESEMIDEARDRR